MATAGIHFSGNEQPSGYISITHDPGHAYIVVNVSEGVALYLPMGENGPKIARALAAALLKAADEHDAILASAQNTEAR